MMRRVGILGGMGPEATILVMQKVLAATSAGDDAGHVPLIVDQNPQVPSRIRHLIDGDGEDPGPVLAEMARRLVAAGAEALAMPCNTAHHYVPAILATVDVPLLNMVDLAVAHAATLTGAGGAVGILGSPAIRKVGLFEAPLAQRGLSALYAADEPAMLAAIRRIKADGPRPEARDALRAASGALAAQGAAVQIIACTEFSLIADAVAENATTFDSMDCMVQAILAFAGQDPNDRANGH